MDSESDGLVMRALSADQQPFTLRERALIDSVYALMETAYDAELSLIVFRGRDGGFVIQEPRQSTPDYDRVIGKLHALIDYLYQE